MKYANRYFVAVFAMLMLSTFIVVVGASSVAADQNSEKNQFSLTCETRERDFYDWVQTMIWTKSRTFHRNLDTAIDALVSNPGWTIRISETKCANDAMVSDRRERLYFMIEDAHSEGAGHIVYGH